MARVITATLNHEEVKSQSGWGQQPQRGVKNKGRSCTAGQDTSVVDIVSDVTEACAIPLFRQGQKCSKDELAASAFLTVSLDDSISGAATQVGFSL